jgi:hypothetical protein
LDCISIDPEYVDPLINPNPWKIRLVKKAVFSETTHFIAAFFTG